MYSTYSITSRTIMTSFFFFLLAKRGNYKLKAATTCVSNCKNRNNIASVKVIQYFCIKFFFMKMKKKFLFIDSAYNKIFYYKFPVTERINGHVIK